MLVLFRAPPIIPYYAVILVAQISGIHSSNIGARAYQISANQQVTANNNMSGTFLYFAYGSNLLADRIHINNPSAKRAGIGKIEVNKFTLFNIAYRLVSLQGYELDFITFSKRWRGNSATIVNRPGSHVWGALWEINNEDMVALDR